MKKKKKRRYVPGRAPGSLDDAAENKLLSLAITDYSAESISRQTTRTVRDIRRPGAGVRRWIQVEGAPTPALLEMLRSQGVHALVLEDIVSDGQRVKLEEHDRYLFTVLRVPSTAQADTLYDLSILLFHDTLITIHEEPNSVLFDPIVRRLENPNSLARRHDIDFLYQAVVDLVVDSYFLSAERLESRTTDLERDVLDNPTPDLLKGLHRLREETRRIRSVLWSTRDVISQLQRGDTSLVKQETLYYIRDVHDHIIHLMDVVTMIRETANGLMELYMTGVSNRMNEVMKVLTIISTIFIPLSFIAGVYGMNFSAMPELRVPWAYPVVLGTMGLIALAMVLFFKRRKWL